MIIHRTSKKTQNIPIILNRITETPDLTTSETEILECIHLQCCHIPVFSASTKSTFVQKCYYNSVW